MMNRYVFLYLVRYIESFSKWYFCVFVSTNLCFRLQVTGVMTQGRGDGKEWVTSFKVSYSMDDYNELYVTDRSQCVWWSYARGSISTNEYVEKKLLKSSQKPVGPRSCDLK